MAVFLTLLALVGPLGVASGQCSLTSSVDRDVAEEASAVQELAMLQVVAGRVERSSDSGSAADPDAAKPTMYIWFQEDVPSLVYPNFTQYAFEPFSSTLLAGIAAYPHSGNVTVNYLILPVRGDVAGEIKKLSLKRSDVFLWLGRIGKDSVPWSHVRQQGALAIYYQTEPVKDCVFTKEDVDELWDYSWANIDVCARNPSAPKLRYIPAAALPKVTSPHPDTAGPLMFFGDSSKRPCWKTLIKQYGEDLNNVFFVNDEQTYVSLVKNYSIWLNLHKACGEDLQNANGNPALEPRITKLLNSQRPVVSQPCYPKDQAEFEGMLDFLPLEAIQDKYYELHQLPAVNRTKLAKERHAKFAEKFAPAALFHRAEIYELLDARMHPFAMAA